MPEILIVEDLEELSRVAAVKFVDVANNSINEKGRFQVSLAGGSTPRSLYRLLASAEYREKIDWSKVFLFFGDERFVPPDHPDSNYRMAKENLFDLIDISDANIFRWPTENVNAEQAAAEYETTIIDFLGSDTFARFDLILLGMGADGHTASLFPNTAALNEEQRIAVANRVDRLDTTRLTLTFPVINNAANVVFLLAGEEKADTLRDILEGAPDPEKYPAQSIKPAGKLIWIVEKKAASKLSDAIS